MMDLRTQVSIFIDKAIDGSINYTGDDPAQNRAVWVELMTDRIMGSFIGMLPEAVDVPKKYELHPQRGLQVSINDDDEHNDMMLEYLYHFSHDDGYNQYRYEVISNLNNNYSLHKQIEPATIPRDGQGSKPNQGEKNEQQTRI